MDKNHHIVRHVTFAVKDAVISNGFINVPTHHQSYITAKHRRTFDLIYSYFIGQTVKGDD